jgi:replicative superfamily II helicase
VCVHACVCRLNQLLQSGTVASRLSMVVIDEVHMLSDSNRGFLLEILLSKILFTCAETVQCVCMSATLPNIEDLSTWLSAALYVTEYRPVCLSICVAMRKRLYKVEPQKQNSKQQQQSSFVTALQHQQQLIQMVPNSEMSMFPQQPASETSPIQAAYGNADTETPASGVSNPPALVASTNNSANSAQVAYIREITSLPPVVSSSSSSSSKDLCLFDDDGLLALCLETVNAGKSVLVFCSSKDQCQKVAQRWAGYYERLLWLQHQYLQQQERTRHQQQQAHTAPFEPQLFVSPPTEAVISARKDVLRQLSQCSVGLCAALQRTIHLSAAHHHAGLTAEERKIVEQGFRDGVIQVLCATSTLAAGVNLPANRVIIRSPYMGINAHTGKRRVLSISSFRQMCGRAGRTGFDSSGEAILLVNHKDASELNVAKQLICAQIEPLTSALHVGAGGGIEKLLLELICCGQLQNESQIEEFVNCTLMNWQFGGVVPNVDANNTADNMSNNNVDTWVRSAITFLRTNQFVLQTNDASLSISQLGMATSRSGLSPTDALYAMDYLVQARKCLMLKGNGFHCVFLVTPISNGISVVPWTELEAIYHALVSDYPDIADVASHVGVKQSELLNFTLNPPSASNNDPVIRFYRRFYNAMILFLLIQEQPLNKLSDQLFVERGAMQMLQKDAAIFCQCICVFVKELNWELLGVCLQTFTSRFVYGVSEELVGLSKISPDITNIRARAMFKEGIKDAKDIVSTGDAKLTDLLVRNILVLICGCMRW